MHARARPRAAARASEDVHHGKAEGPEEHIGEHTINNTIPHKHARAGEESLCPAAHQSEEQNLRAEYLETRGCEGEERRDIEREIDGVRTHKKKRT